jgi:hypothetical protein
MTDMDILADFFLVDHVAERMQWAFVPQLCVEAVRGLTAAASDADTHPDVVMAWLEKLHVAIGPVNLAAVMSHDLWDEWCPQPAGIDPLAYDNSNGVVAWAGKRGYVKCAESDADGVLQLTLHSVRL